VEWAFATDGADRGGLAHGLDHLLGYRKRDAALLIAELKATYPTRWAAAPVGGTSARGRSRPGLRWLPATIALVVICLDSAAIAEQLRPSAAAGIGGFR